METCQRCGTVLPTAPGARYCPNCGELYADRQPTQAFAAVGQPAADDGYPAGESGMTWDLPQPGSTRAFAAPGPTQAVPMQAAPAQAAPAQAVAGLSPAPVEPDHYAELFRPEAASNPNATQVMPPVAAGAYTPAYDQPIDYQAGSEPYDDYPPAARPRSSRAAMIGIGVAAGAVLVIVVSLITLGGGSPTPAATPGSSATEVVTPTTAGSSAPATSSEPTTPSSTAPTTSAPSTAPHPPGTLALGVTGGEVKWLQARLKQLHLYNGEISGTFDAATQAAVEAFQGRTHPADPPGVVGRSTKTALIAAGSKPQLSMLNIGEKHGKGANPADVKRLQQALSTALNTSVKATGQYDVDTFGAVVQYQAAMGLAPDGIVGDKVWSALQQGRVTG